MKLNRGIWLPIALLATALNVAGGLYASLTNEPMHAFVHGAVAVGFGLFARYLWTAAPPRASAIREPDKVEMLQSDLSELERELHETQKRLDFADQLLKNKPPKTPDESQPL
jgi:hypothetical protein